MKIPQTKTAVTFPIPSDIDKTAADQHSTPKNNPFPNYTDANPELIN